MSILVFPVPLYAVCEVGLVVAVPLVCPGRAFGDFTACELPRLGAEKILPELYKRNALREQGYRRGKLIHIKAL